MTRVVVALGGNALLRRGEPAEAELQQRHAAEAAAALASVPSELELVVTHGNGPQVGLLALEAEAYREVEPYPLDVLGAESQGMIGYVLAQELGAKIDRPVAAVVTQVVVDPQDPAFAEPTKPIGRVYDVRTARRLAARHGWALARDGRWLRRVVASPRPLAVVELPLIELLLASSAVVICAGGGGVPVVVEDGRLRGIEAVIDKDRTAALLAEALRADRLVVLTDVAHVERDWATPAAVPITDTTPAELRTLSFASGSMGPKIEATCSFVERTGGTAAIGALEELAAVVRGDAGTQITAAGERTARARARPPRHRRGPTARPAPRAQTRRSAS